jgi:WD40 repeat protein
VQVGRDNTQIIYVYQGTYSDGVAAPPLMSVSGKVDSPYRGLSAFEEQDAPFFFGRRTAIADVLKRMSLGAQETGLLVVSGVSGAGKSSLLRAGVLPQVRGGGLEGASEAASWPRLLFTPGPAPLDLLAVQVAHVAGINADAVRNGLDDNPARFALTARQAALAQPGGSPGERGSLPPGPPYERRLLLVVDQFEQVFTQCQDEKQRQAFITALCAAARDGTEQDPAALVVLGVRADFEARCADYPQLAGAIQDRYLVTSMSELELRMAITEPAKKAGSSVDEDLVKVLLGEVSTRRPGSSGAISGRPSVYGAGILPLLSHALDQAWRSRAGQALTLADYERTGGIEGAVAASAQHAYDSLTPAQQAASRQIFIRLTATTTSSADTAERASRAELAEDKTAAQARDVEAVLEAFASERLLTLAAGTVEISHEVLLTSWPLLRDEWLARTHADRIVRTRLHNAAAEWEGHSRDPSYLYGGSLLEDAAATAARASADPVRYPPLSHAERDFISASERARHRRVRRRQGIIAFLVVLVVGFASAAFLAIRNSQETASERDVAVSGQLAAQSEELGDTNPVLSKLLSVAAWRLDPSDPAASYAMLAAGALPGINVLPAGSKVYTVAFSPDGKVVACGAENGMIWLWNVATGQPVGKPFVSNEGEVNSLAFSPNGHILATGDSHQVIQLWDVATQKPIGKVLRANAGEVNSVAFSPDGRLLASGSDNQAIQVWNVATGQVVESAHLANAGQVNSVAFSSNGQVLADGDSSGTIWLWDVGADRPIGNPLTSHLGGVSSIAFSPGSMTLASGSTNGAVQLWNAANGQLVRTLLSGDAKPVNTVAFSPDGKVLASGSNDETVRLWNSVTGEQIGPSLIGHTGWVNSVAFSPDGRIVASASNDGTIRLWNVPVGQTMGTPAGGNAGSVNSVALSPNGKILVGGTSRGGVWLWNTVTGQQIGDLLGGGTAAVESVACSADGKTMASASSDGTIQLWNVLTQRPIGAPITVGGGAVDSVAFSPNGNILASGSADGTVRLWDVATRQLTGKPFVGHGGPINSVAFSPDGKVLASGSESGTVRLWNTGTHQPQGKPFIGGNYAVTSVAFSPDSKTLASASADYTIRLWDVATENQITNPLNGGTETIDSVAFSPDGAILASGGADGTVRLWDLSTGQEIGSPFTGNGGAVNSVVFSPDGSVLASANADGTAQLWNFAYLQNIVPYLCGSTGQSLSSTEWAEYVGSGPGYQNVCPPNA